MIPTVLISILCLLVTPVVSGTSLEQPSQENGKSIPTTLAQLMDTFYSDSSYDVGVSTILIVGGTEATPHQFPFQVSIQVRDYVGGYRHHCGGIIYDSLHILTAAHCVRGYHPKNFKIVAGEHELFQDEGAEQYRDIAGYIFHPGFDSPRLSNDIAIITLDWPLDLNSQIRALHVPKEIRVNPSIGRTVGWGRDGVSDEQQTKLLYVDLEIFSREECLEAYAMYEITETMLCAGNKSGGKGACNGDSGGPLICKDEANQEYLCGLVSWGMIPCALPQYPSVFTNINQLLDWLHSLLPEQEELEFIAKLK